MSRNLFTIADYGNISIDIRKYMDKNNISRSALARACNTRFEVVDKWYNGSVERIDTDVLARICYVLSCTPGDIILYHSGDGK